MSTCQVLRCQQPAAEIFTLLKDPLLEDGVCSGHKARLEGGAKWMFDADSGILMDLDLPHTVTEATLSGLLSGESGVSLNLELDTPDGPRSMTLWLSNENADDLGRLLVTRLIR